MSNDSNTKLLTGSIREQYIAQRFGLNGGHESTVDVNNLSEKFMKLAIGLLLSLMKMSMMSSLKS